MMTQYRISVSLYSFIPSQVIADPMMLLWDEMAAVFALQVDAETTALELLAAKGYDMLALEVYYNKKEDEEAARALEAAAEAEAEFALLSLFGDDEEERLRSEEEWEYAQKYGPDGCQYFP